MTSEQTAHIHVTEAQCRQSFASENGHDKFVLMVVLCQVCLGIYNDYLERITDSFKDKEVHQTKRGDDAN